MRSRLYILTLITLLSCQSDYSFAQSPNWLWANGIGGGLNEKGQAVATDAAGNTYITGSFQGTVDFDPANTAWYRTSAGDLDIYLWKLDPAGNYLWVQQMGGTGTDEGNSIVYDPAGYVYVTGHFQGTADFDGGPDTTELVSAGNYDIFITKYDDAGNFIWAKQMGGSSLDDGLGITLDGAGNIYTTGYFATTSDFDPDPVLTTNIVSMGGQDIFISKLDSGGNFIWAKGMGSAVGDKGQGIAVDNAGNVFTTGFFVQTADFDPGPGIYNLTSSGSGDIFILKLDSSGSFSWACGLGKTTTDKGSAIAVDASGNVYTTGVFAGTVDFDPSLGSSFSLTSGGSGAAFISKLTNAGTFVWAKAITTVGTNTALGQSMVLDPVTGDISLAGNFTAATNFDPGITDFTLADLGLGDVFIARFDSSGNFGWAKAIGGTNTELCGSLALTSTGNLYLAGTYYSPKIVFDSDSIINAVTTGFPDIFVAKLDYGLTIVCNPGFPYKLFVFPVPATDRLTLSMPGNTERVDVHITDMSGRIIFESAFTDEELNIATEDFAKGVYLLRLTSGNYNTTRSIIIDK